MCNNTQAPIKAKTTAGIPNLISTGLSAFLPTKKILNTLLKKCTKPVSAIANSTGKKSIKIGVRIVPSPNPEKNVRMATKNATTDIKTISI
jgi:porphobilinogen deaminase